MSHSREQITTLKQNYTINIHANLKQTGGNITGNFQFGTLWNFCACKLIGLFILRFYANGG